MGSSIHVTAVLHIFLRAARAVEGRAFGTSPPPATRANPDSVANHGINDFTDHYAKVIDDLPAPPILIGHSFGGLIAEKLLGMDRGAAGVAIDAAQIKGVLQVPLS
jgi:pimeloyl-ACP methyl ester carboxylesterase